MGLFIATACQKGLKEDRKNRRTEWWREQRAKQMSLWPATVSSVCLCCPGASPTNTTSFLKWLIPEKGSTRSRPPSSSTNDGSTWANTDAALEEINGWIFWAHTQSHKLIPTLSHYIIVIINGTIFWHSLSFSVVRGDTEPLAIVWRMLSGVPLVPSTHWAHLTSVILPCLTASGELIHLMCCSVWWRPNWKAH